MLERHSLIAKVVPISTAMDELKGLLSTSATPDINRIKDKVSAIKSLVDNFLNVEYTPRKNRINGSKFTKLQELIQVLIGIKTAFTYTTNNSLLTSIQTNFSKVHGSYKTALKNLATFQHQPLPAKVATAPAPAPALPPAPPPAPAPALSPLPPAPTRLPSAEPPLLPARTPPTFIHNNPAPSITPSRDDFFELHESAGCGRHALNNLLGGVNFIKEYSPSGDITDISELPQKPVALQTICRYLQAKMTDTQRPTECPDNEYYDQSVLEAGMRLFGYTSNYSTIYISKPASEGSPRVRRDNTTIMREIDSLEDKNYIGFLVHFPGHWTTIRKINGEFKYIDSLKPDKRLRGTLNDIINNGELLHADVVIPYYYTGITTDYTQMFKEPLYPGQRKRLKEDEATKERIQNEYALPVGHVLVKNNESLINSNGRHEYIVVPDEIASAFTGSSATAGNSGLSAPAASAAAGTPPLAPAPKTPFYYYDNDIIKITEKPDGPSVYQILNADNTWGNEKNTADLIVVLLEPIDCPPKKQDGGRRKRIRRTVRAKPKTRPTRRLRKRV